MCYKNLFYWEINVCVCVGKEVLFPLCIWLEVLPTNIVLDLQDHRQTYLWGLIHDTHAMLRVFIVCAWKTFMFTLPLHNVWSLLENHYETETVSPCSVFNCIVVKGEVFLLIEYLLKYFLKYSRRLSNISILLHVKANHAFSSSYSLQAQCPNWKQPVKC